MSQIPIARPLIGADEKEAVMAVLDSGIMAQGPRVAEFESSFAKYCGAKYGIATSNGTTSLHLAMLAAGVGAGDEVITTPFSFFATGSTIVMCNARPVFADIDPATFNIDPQAVAAAVTDRTKAVMPVHLYGQPCDMDPLREICADRDIAIIEDACQAHDAEYKGRRSGNLGDMAGFSFYPTKNMTTGEGGIVVTSDEELADEVRLLRSHGQSSRYKHASMGFNFRMTDIAAAIGIKQLQRLPEFTARRRENAALLDEGLGTIDGITPPPVAPDRKHVYHQYTVRARDRDGLLEHLKQAGIGFGVHYPQLISSTPAMAAYASDCPLAEQATKEVLSLPVHPSVSTEDARRIISVIRDFYKK